MKEISLSSHYLLITWIDYCKKNSILHSKSSAYFRRWNIFTSVPGIVLSTLSGITSITLSFQNVSMYFSIAAGIGALTSTILFSINKLLRYPELQELHDVYGDNFEILHNEIQMQMSITSQEELIFRSRTEFLKYCKYKLDILIDKAPIIPENIEKNYNKDDALRGNIRNRYSIDLEKSIMDNV